MLNLVVVDDHPLVRQGLKYVLSLESDLKVAGEAATIQEALALINTTNPDLVLLDIRLGSENGLDIIVQCQKLHPDCKFLILTSSADEYDFKQARSLGVQGYILKDALPEELIYAIQLVGKGRKYYDPKIMDEMMDESGHEDLQELTERELEVLKALGEGLCNKEIAEKLFISIFTVKKHVSQILTKLNLTDRTQAALLAQSNENEQHHRLESRVAGRVHKQTGRPGTATSIWH